MKCFYFFLLAAALWSLTRCELFSQERQAQFPVPDLPAIWNETFPQLGLDITVFTADGAYNRNMFFTAAAVEETPGCRLQLTIPKAPTVFILAVPSLRETSIGLLPLGAVAGYGDAGPSEPMALSFAAGFVAQRCMSLVEKGYDIKLFNAKKLVCLLEDSGQDPWTYDAVGIEEDIAAGVFNTFSMKKLPVYEHEVLLPAGTWFSENPKIPSVISDGSIPVSTGPLTAGYHCLFRAGTDDRAGLMVTEQEAIIILQLCSQAGQERQLPLRSPCLRPVP